MKSDYKGQLSLLRRELVDTQKYVIGVFKPKYHAPGHYIPVVSDTDGVLHCIEVGTLLGLDELTIGMNEGHYVPFTNYTYGSIRTTLDKMMNDPMKFHKWWADNCNQ